MNLVPKLILRSPWHGAMSSKYLELTFTGVRSGRSYTTPVAYVTVGSLLLISTDSPWSHNITTGTRVTFAVAQPHREAIAAAVRDQRTVIEIIPNGEHR